jgi:hypothetical protein
VGCDATTTLELRLFHDATSTLERTSKKENAYEKLASDKRIQYALIHPVSFRSVFVYILPSASWFPNCTPSFRFFLLRGCYELFSSQLFHLSLCFCIFSVFVSPPSFFPAMFYHRPALLLFYAGVPVLICLIFCYHAKFRYVFLPCLMSSAWSSNYLRLYNLWENFRIVTKFKVITIKRLL